MVVQKRFYLVLIIICFVFGNCKSQKTKNISACLDNDLSSLALSTNQVVSEKNVIYKNFFKALEALDYINAKQLLLNIGYVIDSTPSGYFLLLPGRKDASAFEYYLSYRFSESQNDVDKNTLYKLLVESYGRIIKDDINESCISGLLELEHAYLKAVGDNRKPDTADMAIISNTSTQATGVGRPEFLWAKANYELGNYNESILTIKKIISEQGYNASALQLLVRNYRKLNSDSAKYYLKILSGQFPKACIIDFFEIQFKDSLDVKLLDECNKCLGNGSVNDSIRAKVAVAIYYLNNNNLDEAKKIAFNYYSNDSMFSFSKIQLWERRQYFNLYSQILFLKKEYFDLCIFSINEGGKYGIRRIDDSEDLRSFIESIYLTHPSTSTEFESFDKFYKVEIEPILYKLPKSAYKG